MKSAAEHSNEASRLEALLRYEVLDTEDEAAFDELTELASAICDTPISLVSLVDDHRQWFKSKVGIGANETSKDIAFCSHAILQEQVFEVQDALQDERFADNPLVSGAPDIRFYAGAPLRNAEGLPIGTLCVIDTEARELSDDQRRALQVLAKQVISQLDLRLNNRRLERLNSEREQLFAVLAHDLRSPFNSILGVARRLKNRAKDLSPADVGSMSELVLNSSLSVYQLLDELLQWSENRLGATQCNLHDTPLLPLLEETLAFMSENAELKSIELHQHVDSVIQVKGDATLIKTTLRNLLANAIKYAPEGGRVEVIAAVNGDQVEISVQDNGDGVPEFIKKSLFVECVESQQGSQGETGHGLGLSLSFDFVRMQGGRMWLDESYTDGAKITFSLSSV